MINFDLWIETYLEESYVNVPWGDVNLFVGKFLSFDLKIIIDVDNTSNIFADVE